MRTRVQGTRTRQQYMHEDKGARQQRRQQGMHEDKVARQQDKGGCKAAGQGCKAAGLGCTAAGQGCKTAGQGCKTAGQNRLCCWSLSTARGQIFMNYILKGINMNVV